ncbi:hypothetical protein M0802_008923 [Mischocyttarus mexicanus]|nr:hypothetical protein M0802_008923 [Mischocyttarus mexicanus]
MRFTIVGCVLTVVLAVAVAGPISKISEKKSLIGNTKLAKEEEGTPKIDEIGADKDRSKKSTTTFCVEIRPGSNELTQCSCKDKETHNQHLAAQQISHPQAMSYAATQPAQLQPAGSPHSVNIIHAPAQPPQTLNIIQPAPTLHAVQFLQPQPQSQNPSSVQTLNFLQPSSNKPSEPFQQTLQFTIPSKQEEKPEKQVKYEKIMELPAEHHTIHEQASKPAPEVIVLPQPAPQPAPEVIVLPQPAPQSAPEVIVLPQPAPQPAPEVILAPPSTPQPAPEVILTPPSTPKPEHTDTTHKSEIHVSVTTEDKKEQEEHKYIPESLPSPVEPTRQLPYNSESHHYEEQVVVVPNPILVQHQENCPSALIQIPSVRYQPSESVIQFPGSSYQQTGPFRTECSCQQARPIHSNHHLANPSSELRTHRDRPTQIVPMVIYPPAAPTFSGSASYQSPHREMVPMSGQMPSSLPMIISMQTARNKEGMQEGMSGMTSSARRNDLNANMLKDMNSGLAMKDHARQSMSNFENQMVERNMEMMSDANRSRFVRNDKNAKITDKIVETKKISEKTSSIKTA